ncbi:uncharacterized protein LAESUDRAFT_722040 [Laetiporus sulphureus 93-53]|uniref:Uncharacterized protein n=1 Tax=Laetiporus sulphureus 93-53 TaxID=1314785 RepID=A0A165G6F3_9APHY|nr:uncharacterized protein LAESUDRAFT_722040 [Laetiporus sulphureus 93-53]KZT09890.1 hypothetical protein LAESUDRAFT_722040 [Laetiporus sulphureus 93-53]
MGDAYVLQTCSSSLDKSGTSMTCMTESDIARKTHLNHECHGRHHAWTAAKCMPL